MWIKICSGGKLLSIRPGSHLGILRLRQNGRDSAHNLKTHYNHKKQVQVSSPSMAPKTRYGIVAHFTAWQLRQSTPYEARQPKEAGASPGWQAPHDAIRRDRHAIWETRVKLDSQKRSRSFFWTTSFMRCNLLRDNLGKSTPGFRCHWKQRHLNLRSVIAVRIVVILSQSQNAQVWVEPPWFTHMRF